MKPKALMRPKSAIVVFTALLTVLVVYELEPTRHAPRASIASTQSLTASAPVARDRGLRPAAQPKPQLPAVVATGAATPTLGQAARAADAADLATKNEVLEASTTPEQHEYRATWAREVPDDSWTMQMQDELRTKVRANIEGDVKVSHLSCRETICRMFLQFADQLDVDAFMATPYGASFDYRFQSLDPDFDGTGFDRSDYTHELLIKRPRPGSPEAAEAAKLALRPGETVMLGRKHVAPSIAMTE
jgi:hypothetical protein